MLDDKPVTSNSLITLGLIWTQRWLCIISGSNMLPDIFLDTETADFFFLETLQNQYTLKASENQAQPF